MTTTEPVTTEYTKIFDLFTMLIKDFNLINLYKSSETDFNSYLTGWLLFAINEFISICDQDLNDRDDEGTPPVEETDPPAVGAFNFAMSLENKIMLAELMVKYWLTKEIQDIMQMNIHLQDRDFKTYSEAQNLQAKNAYLIATRERCSQLLMDYQFKKLDWSTLGKEL